ncbi:MAG TPA: LPS assembly lipoprotein LptE [Burkholderiaceae bacterium]|nr:LPS assembly lipoprotein LptE [Burkholderiaceae bacterium]
MHSRPAAIGNQRSSRHWLQLGLCMALCLVLVACGFRLKGASPLPFDTLYTNIEENSPFGANLRRAIVASSPHTRFVSNPGDAEARLTQLANREQLRELSIDADGQVEEYELNLQFVFQLTDAHGRIVLPPTELRATREVPYDPDDSQAKHAEIRMVFEDMQESLIARIVRHLSAPDVTQAFQRVRQEPVPDRLQETLDPVEIPGAESRDSYDEWDESIPGIMTPLR